VGSPPELVDAPGTAALAGLQRVDVLLAHGGIRQVANGGIRRVGSRIGDWVRADTVPAVRSRNQPQPIARSDTLITAGGIGRVGVSHMGNWIRADKFRADRAENQPRLIVRPRRRPRRLRTGRRARAHSPGRDPADPEPAAASAR
jgi:hypothetical protein